MLNIEYLVSQKYLSPTGNPITLDWKKFDTGNYGVFVIFKGEYDPVTNMPCGVVRAIDSYGSLCEGQWSKDGQMNGWNIRYSGTGIEIGWFKNSTLHGNAIRL